MFSEGVLNGRERVEALSIPISSTIRQAMEAINRGAQGVALLVAPVTNRFVGLVTDGDIRRALLNGHGLESPVAGVPRPEARTARVGLSPDDLMTLLGGSVRIVPLLDDNGQVADLAVFDRRVHLPVAAPVLGDKELQYVTESIVTGWISSGGTFVTRFEEMFAAFCGTRYAIATSSGTTALHLAVLALDIGPGDEVIVPTFTFIATANAVAYCGARPVFVDSEQETWNIDPERVEEAITPRTKAIIPVHLYGHPADMDPILEIGARYGLAVIEDAAEAHGARYKGRRVGGLGDVGTSSFYGNKIITTGEGGMVTTNRSDLADKVRLLRDHGMSPTRRYWHPVLGYNYRLTNLQAAVGVAQMEKAEAIVSAKRRIARAYGEGLREVPGITLPPEAHWASNVFWLYSVLVDPESFGRTRDDVVRRLAEQGIETRRLFPPVHTQPVYDTGQYLPVAERLAATGFSLPSPAGLKVEDVHRVIEAIIGLRGYGENCIQDSRKSAGE